MDMQRFLFRKKFDFYINKSVYEYLKKEITRDKEGDHIGNYLE